MRSAQWCPLDTPVDDNGDHHHNVEDDDDHHRGLGVIIMISWRLEQRVRWKPQWQQKWNFHQFRRDFRFLLKLISIVIFYEDDDFIYCLQMSLVGSEHKCKCV